MVKKELIKKIMKETSPRKNYFFNSLMAFIFGGIICLIGQGLLELFQNVFMLDEKISISLMSITVIAFSSILTGLGIFDKIGQIAGAGTYLPISGFANSMTSAAIESRSEGLIFGILSNMLKLAGAVIVTGVISAFVVASFIFWVM